VAHTASCHRGSPAAHANVSWFERHSTLYRVLLILYYLAILVALIAIYGRGDFSTPPFVYQGF
jgi:hypothetical protein